MPVIMHSHGTFRFPFSSSLITVLFTESLKSLTQRSRPRKQSIADRSLPIRDDVSNPAFPSGDSAQVCNSVMIDCRPQS